MGAADLLQHLRTAGFSITAAGGGGIRVAPAGALSVDQRQAIRDHKPELLALLAAGQAQVDSPLDGRSAVAIPTQTCAGCQNLTRRKTCSEPAAAGLDPPPGHPAGADWFGIRWPPAGHGATCPGFAL